MLHALRLTFSAPRRLDFRRVSPAVSISYGFVTEVKESEIEDLIKNEALFRHHMALGHIQKISRETIEEIESENKRVCADELRNPNGQSQGWVGVSKGADGLPTIEVTDAEASDSNQPGANHAAAEKKAREKLRAFAVASKKPAAKTSKTANAAA